MALPQLNIGGGWARTLLSLQTNIDSTFAPQPRNNKIAVLGDSITNNNSTSTGGFESNGYLTWANQFSRQRFRFEHALNFGVPGDTSEQAYARIDDVLANDAGTVVVAVGTNDRGSAAFTYTQTISYLTAIRDKLLKDGRIVVLVCPLPRGDSTYTSNRLTGDQLAYHIRVREWVLSNKGVRGVYPVDSWVYTADATSSTGDIKLGYTSDGLHPNVIGSFWHGKAIAEQALNLILPEPYILATSNADVYGAINNPQGSIILNPMFSGTTGIPGTGGSGNLATSYTGTNATGTTAVTRTYSKVTSGGKDWQQIVLGAGPTTAEGALDLVRQISLHASVSAGDVIEGMIEYEVDAGTTGVMSLQLGLQLTDANGTTTLWDGDRYTGGSMLLPDVAFSGVMRTPRITVGATPTDLRFRLSCYVPNATSPVISVRCRAASLRKIV